MFKHYLTYQFAVGFERSCSSLEMPLPQKSKLVKACKQMMQNFSEAVNSSGQTAKGKSFYLALNHLYDCGAVLRAEKRNQDQNIWGPYQVLQMRLERLCLKAAEEEKGQLRMLG